MRDFDPATFFVFGDHLHSIREAAHFPIILDELLELRKYLSLIECQLNISSPGKVLSARNYVSNFPFVSFFFVWFPVEVLSHFIPPKS